MAAARGQLAVGLGNVRAQPRPHSTRRSRSKPRTRSGDDALTRGNRASSANSAISATSVINGTDQRARTHPGAHSRSDCFAAFAVTAAPSFPGYSPDCPAWALGTLHAGWHAGRRKVGAIMI